MQTLDETTTVIDLEQLVNGDDAQCEARHHDGTTCSHEVTHRFLGECRNRDAKVCANIAAMCVIHQGRGVVCSDCRRPARICWTIYPI